VLARDGRTCCLCGRHADALGPNETLIADHYPDGVLDVDDPFDAATCRCVCSTCSGTSDGTRGH
jgi:hypothetical protein